MLVRVEELARMSHVMADGGAGEHSSARVVDVVKLIELGPHVFRCGTAVGSVLRNWNQVFSILNLFGKCLSRDPESRLDLKYDFYLYADAFF